MGYYPSMNIYMGLGSCFSAENIHGHVPTQIFYSEKRKKLLYFAFKNIKGVSKKLINIECCRFAIVAFYSSLD